MSERLTGIVKFFNNEKGFGFIAPDNGQRDIFVHYSSIQSNGFRSLMEGDRVEFTLENSEKGPRAAEVVKI